MSRVLVTGATGFVGNRLCKTLTEAGYNVRAGFRRPYPYNNDLAVQESVVVGDIGSNSKWEDALQDVDCVIHLAARVHVMKEVDGDPLAAFLEVNSEGTVCLAEQAAGLGVKRFVYVSSIKVNGEETSHTSFAADDQPNPQDFYGVSKAEAELRLQEISSRTGMAVVIVRPPLVYGSGVRGNFLRLMKLVEHGIPLPFAMVNNTRSMITLKNLTDLLVKCLEHPKAVGEIFLVSDGIDWSTPGLIRSIAQNMDVPARLFPVPLLLLMVAGRITGQWGAISRICSSLQVDFSKTQELLEWTPSQSPEEGIQEAVAWYLRKKNV